MSVEEIRTTRRVEHIDEGRGIATKISFTSAKDVKLFLREFMRRLYDTKVMLKLRKKMHEAASKELAKRYSECYSASDIDLAECLRKAMQDTKVYLDYVRAWEEVKLEEKKS